MVYIGVDPGASGGIAWIHNGKACAEPYPETPTDLIELLADIRTLSDRSYAMLELVHSSPQMGVKSAFSFGQNYGGWEFALTSAGIPFERVRPQEWQKELKCLTGGDKNVSKRRAQEMFPDLKITHSVADALLLAEYCRRQRLI